MQTILLNFTCEKKNGGKKKKSLDLFFCFFFFSSTFRDYDQANWISERYQKSFGKIFKDKLNKITREFITVT